MNQVKQNMVYSKNYEVACKNKLLFPTDEVVLKLGYLALREVNKMVDADPKLGINFQPVLNH